MIFLSDMFGDDPILRLVYDITERLCADTTP